MEKHIEIYPPGYTGRFGENNQVRCLNAVEHRPNRQKALYPPIIWVNAEKKRPYLDKTGLISGCQVNRLEFQCSSRPKASSIMR